MARNEISVTLSQEDLDEILAALEVVKRKLPFLVHLNAEDRIAYPKMGDKTVAFVNKSLQHARESTHLVPPFLSVTEFEKDMELVSQLKTILRPFNNLMEGLESTLMLAGSESYTSALVFYRAVKMANELNEPEAKAIYEDLRKRFPTRPLQITPETASSASNGNEETGENGLA